MRRGVGGFIGSGLPLCGFGCGACVFFLLLPLSLEASFVPGGGDEGALCYTGASCRLGCQVCGLICLQKSCSCVGGCRAAVEKVATFCVVQVVFLTVVV